MTQPSDSPVDATAPTTRAEGHQAVHGDLRAVSGASHVPLNRGTDPVSRRVYALIFNGLTTGLARSGRFLLLSERERVTAVIYDTLRAGGIEVRLADGLEALRRAAAELDESEGASRG